MVLTVLLCRHGNTFESGQTPYMVGQHEDLELTNEGEAQARRAGDALAAYRAKVNCIVAAPLRRTRSYARILASRIAYDESQIVLDPRLAELDYGEWSGKTTVEIEQKYGSEELAAWNECGRWPKAVSFSPPLQQVESELRELFLEIVTRQLNCCLITSNGRIKVLSELLSLATPKKMGTGNISILHFENGQWSSSGWNLTPDELKQALE